MAPTQARTRVDTTINALEGWLWSTRWTWPLAAVLTAAVLSRLHKRRGWSRSARGMLLAIGIFAGLIGLASLTTATRPRLGLMVLAVVVAVGLLATWVVVIPHRLAPPVPEEVLGRLSDHRQRLEAADARTKLQNDLRTTALQAVAGLAVLAGAVLGFQQLSEDRQQAVATRELTLQGQASERFTRAIDQLGSDRREVQLGAIYGLEQIAQQAPDNRLAVTEVLVAYLHRRAPMPAKPPRDIDPVEELRIRAPDIQAALTVLGRRQAVPDDPRLDLRALNLRDADLALANLSGADLTGTDLSSANLERANVSEAFLNGAKLDFAALMSANLNNADLSGANLDSAFLNDANLNHASLLDANLGHANLSNANLTGAFLKGANLSRANLAGTILKGATAELATRWPDGFDHQGARVLLD